MESSLTERGLVVHRSLCSAKQVPAGLGLVQDDFPYGKFVICTSLAKRRP